MAKITKPIILDETAQREATALETIASHVGYLKGDKGEKGDTPVKGVDYFTDEDKLEMENSTKALVEADIQPTLNAKQDKIDDLETIRSGASAGATAYQKPSTGIAKTDLASAVQTSLGKADTALQKSDVVNNVTSTTTDAPLSANMGKTLQDEIDTLKSRGRYLSQWNASTGKPATDPSSLPYAYANGDYFIVGTIGTKNYKPTGTSYTGAASTTEETAEVAVEDTYYFDGATWHLQQNTQKTVSFANLAGSPSDNTNLASALNAKEDAFKIGEGLELKDGTLSNTRTSAEWGKITGTLTDQTDLKNALGAKQDTISDLSTIRSNASKGASAVQFTDFATTSKTGVIKASDTLGTSVDSTTGNLTAKTYTATEYNSYTNGTFVGKGTLENVINGRVFLTGTSAPTSSTVGYYIGQLYIDITNSKTYELTAISTANSTNTYTWTQLVRTTDYATTDVAGVIKDGTNGIRIASGTPYLYHNDGLASSRTTGYAVHYSDIDLITKLALTDGKGTAYTADEQTAARTRLGVINTTVKYWED